MLQQKLRDAESEAVSAVEISRHEAEIHRQDAEIYRLKAEAKNAAEICRPEAERDMRIRDTGAAHKIREAKAQIELADIKAAMQR